MWTTTSKIKFIQLEHRDTSVKEWINIDHIERFSDGEIYLNGKKYKVKESAKEIAQLITLEVVKA